MFLFTIKPEMTQYVARPQLNRQFIRVTKETIEIGHGYVSKFRTCHTHNHSWKPILILYENHSNHGVGIYLDNELNHGTTACSATYGNQALDGSNANSSDFQVKQVELWGFS